MEIPGQPLLSPQQNNRVPGISVVCSEGLSHAGVQFLWTSGHLQDRKTSGHTENQHSHRGPCHTADFLSLSHYFNFSFLLHLFLMGTISKSLLNMLQHCFWFFFFNVLLLDHKVTLAPRPGIEPIPCIGGWILSHWTTTSALSSLSSGCLFGTCHFFIT